MPSLDLLRNKNIYSGSRGNFCYKIFPSEKITAVVWQGPFCLEKSEPIATSEFELTEEGHKALFEWICSACEEWEKNNL